MGFRAAATTLSAALTMGAALAAILPAPALAHGGPGRPMVTALPPVGPAYWGGSFGGWHGTWQQPWVVSMPATSVAPPPDGAPPQDRDAWLRECRRRLADNGVGGAVIGGVVGGVAGNVIAGHGDKLLGTVAGAAVGAVAGAAIDKAQDRVRDRCEEMLESGPAYAYGPGGYLPGGYIPAGYMMVPVMMVPVQAPAAAKPACKETVVTEEFVTYVPRRHVRHIPRRAPDKRVRTGS